MAARDFTISYKVVSVCVFPVSLLSDHITHHHVQVEARIISSTVHALVVVGA